MNKFFFAFIASVVIFSADPDVFSASKIHLLAPAEESFIGMDQILIIGRVPDGVKADRVDISDNGKFTESAVIREGTFVLRAGLGEGLHEIVLSIPEGEAKSLKIFVGRQEGYRYHIETGIDSCGDCHAEASRHRYRIGPMQADICSKCHEPIGTSEYVHGPVAAGSCTPCHDPHGSKHEKFLVATGKDLCLTCHDQNLSKNHVEKRQNAQCIKCHSPHSSSRNYHLR
jgi:predicted CXXCH cytochrome family protein